MCPRYRSTNREGTLAEFSASSWYDKRRACGWPETLAVSRVGDGLNHVTDIDWTMLLTNWVHQQTQFRSGSRLLTSEVVVKQTWHGLVVTDQISILQRRSELVAAAGWHISASWQECSYSSPICWWWMHRQVVSALAGWRIYVLLGDAVVGRNNCWWAYWHAVRVSTRRQSALPGHAQRSMA